MGSRKALSEWRLVICMSFSSSSSDMHDLTLCSKAWGWGGQRRRLLKQQIKTGSQFLLPDNQQETQNPVLLFLFCSSSLCLLKTAKTVFCLAKWKTRYHTQNRHKNFKAIWRLCFLVQSDQPANRLQNIDSIINQWGQTATNVLSFWVWADLWLHRLHLRIL